MMDPVDIPACFDGEDLAPDLAYVAGRAGLSPAQVVAAYVAAEYIVDFLGFAPGFAYLRGLPTALATPRLESPRTRVPAGSVGIAGAQTGVYPLSTPGGWRLIGRTPERMFDPDRNPPARLAKGDRVRFVPIDRAEFDRRAREAGRVAGASGVAERAAGPVGWRVVAPGMQTTVQDLGRPGYEHLGVSRSGAADALSLQLGNLALGQPPTAAGLEMTLVGATLECQRDSAVVLTGSNADAEVVGPGGQSRPLLAWTPSPVRAGERIRIGALRDGARAYLTVLGGVGVAPLLGSRATHLMSGLGGVDGRALRAGDALAVGAAGAVGLARPVPAEVWARVLAHLRRPAVRVRPGSGWAGFSAQARAAFFDADFEITPRADRTGLRLRGPGVAGPALGGVMSSQPMSFGDIQWPDGGEPIVLGPDAPPTGGYPVIAHVIDADRPVVGQWRPGDHARFELVNDEQAEQAAREVESWTTW